MFVYTFWEPRENIPYYLRLCMATWKKFLPNATIVILDYKNIGELLDVRELGLNLFSDKRFGFMHISDALRIAILAKYGGVWLDIDTIILSRAAEKYFLPDEKHRAIFFGDPESRGCYTAFINAPPAAMCLNLWREFNREKIWNLSAATVIDWDFFSNSFINDYAKNFPSEIKILDNRAVMLEISSDNVSNENSYLEYYFLQNHHLADVNADMLLLHNSWTPSMFKEIPPEKFFHIDCTMVNVLAEALEIRLPPLPTRFRVEAQN